MKTQNDVFRILTNFSIVTVVLALAACSPPDNNPKTSNSYIATETDTYLVEINQDKMIITNKTTEPQIIDITPYITAGENRSLRTLYQAYKVLLDAKSIITVMKNGVDVFENFEYINFNSETNQIEFDYQNTVAEIQDEIVADASFIISNFFSCLDLNPYIFIAGTLGGVAYGTSRYITGLFLNDGPDADIIRESTLDGLLTSIVRDLLDLQLTELFRALDLQDNERIHLHLSASFDLTNGIPTICLNLQDLRTMVPEEPATPSPLPPVTVTVRPPTPEPVTPVPAVPEVNAGKDDQVVEKIVFEDVPSWVDEIRVGNRRIHTDNYEVNILTVDNDDSWYQVTYIDLDHYRDDIVKVEFRLQSKYYMEIDKTDSDFDGNHAGISFYDDDDTSDDDVEAGSNSQKYDFRFEINDYNESFKVNLDIYFDNNEPERRSLDFAEIEFSVIPD